MFCNNCGVELKDGMTFCPNCGAQAAGEMPAGDDGKTSVLRDGDVQEQETAPSVEEKAEADPEEHGDRKNRSSGDLAHRRDRAGDCRGCSGRKRTEEILSQLRNAEWNQRSVLSGMRYVLRQ